MKIFKYIEEAEDWLEPMDYVGFWYATYPYQLALLGHDRNHCDDCIANAGVREEDILSLVKWFARIELTEKLSLQRRPITPWVQLVEAH